jgi:2-keto-4-pentenoate hydratase/2-oxohepta-3-ene-1,7-dioic acid hydratase in catechol pathway
MTNQNITRYVRYTQGGRTSFGILDGDTIRQLNGDILDGAQPTGQTARVSDVQLEVPLDPSRVQKVIGVAANYNPPGEKRDVFHPRWFAKLPTSLNRHGADVEMPTWTTNFNFEGELAVIIGKKGRHVSMEDAPSYVFGVTVGNDWSENTWFREGLGAVQVPPFEDPTRFISKCMDGWACLYTTIVTGLDYSDLDLEIRLNDDLVAKGRTSDMTNNVARLISYLSYFVTLMPGDVIYTGTVAPPSFPGKRRVMQPGDEVKVKIENIGELSNRVVALKGGDSWDAQFSKMGSAVAVKAAAT